jgi:UPF0176 protein
MKPYCVASFYKFVSLENLEPLSNYLLEICREQKINGTILLAEEGINATICGKDRPIEQVLFILQTQPQIGRLSIKYSYHDEQPFARLKVKIKPEIVTLGLPEISPTKRVGTYVKPRDWNQIISDPDVVVIDTRNGYEVEVGTFLRAVDPKTASFRQFPEDVQSNLDPQQHRKVAMFCTGGIRCEKASAYMLEQGFDEVYHLEGGILQYLEDVSPEESLWRGECFVFDERVTVDHELQRGEYSLCESCGSPVKLGEKLCREHKTLNDAMDNAVDNEPGA